MTPLHLRARVRRLPGGDVLVKAGVFVLGAAFVVLGVLLAVLPGPLTIPPVLLGVAIWSLEFTWAARLLVRVRAAAQAAWGAARRNPVRSALVTGAGLVLAAAAGWYAVHADVLGAVRDRLR